MLSNATPLPRKFGLFVIAFFSLLILPATGSAQLIDPATWVENVSLDADASVGSASGSDDALPEPLIPGLGGPGYDIDGSVTFNSPGAPNTTAAMSASYTSGLSSFLGGAAHCEINFSFRVVETSPPPFTLANVRVDITASGTADAGGDSELFANVSAIFIVGTPAQPTLVNLCAEANNNDFPSSSFNETNQIILGPTGGANVTMIATASINGEVLVSGTSATATAFVDPVIVISDDLIVGGNGAKYSDHYAIEFADGYWALGMPTPVEHTTWGKIKRLYAN